MKNKNNKFLYINESGEEALLPLSRLLGSETTSDTNINFYFDNHQAQDGIDGKAMLLVAATVSSDAEGMLKTLGNAFANHRGPYIDLLGGHDGITAVNVTDGVLGGAVTSDMTAGSGITSATGELYYATVRQEGLLRKTEIFIDLTGLHVDAGAKDVIGDNGEANVHFGQITALRNGTIIAGRMTCLEAPGTGQPDIDLVESTVGTRTQGDDYDADGTSAVLLAAAADWTVAAGVHSRPLTGLPTADRYLYLANGDSGTNGEYDAGKFLIELWGTV